MDTSRASKPPIVSAEPTTAGYATGVVTGVRLLASSADLKSDSIDTNREFGIDLSDPAAVMKAEAFFEEVWDESAAWKPERPQRP